MKYSLYTEEYVWYAIKQMFMYLHTALEVEVIQAYLQCAKCLEAELRHSLVLQDLEIPAYVGFGEIEHHWIP